MKSRTTNTPYFDPRIPRVAIVGRPNVGKSTLFNRLLGRRKSITDPTPGVTRDPVRSLWQLFGHKAVLIDTGGLTESKEFLDQHITKKSLEAADAADVLVFVVDVEGLTSDDEDFVRRLRRLAPKLIVAVNKVDSDKRSAQVHEFHRLGFSEVVGVSAAHGLGCDELVEAIAAKLAITDRRGPTGAIDANIGAAEDEEDVVGESATAESNSIPDGSGESAAIDRDARAHWDISVAILGQPNVGKSTLLNLLTESDLSLVSPVAGTTRDVIEGSFRFGKTVFRILDTAGIRRKARVKEDLEYFSVNRAIAAIEEADVIFLVIDATKGLTDQDKKIAAQIVKLGRGVILVVNKWDLLEGVANQYEAVSDRMRFLFPVLSFAPIVAISAQTGEGIQDLLRQALKINTQLRTRIDTGPLNQMVNRWVTFTPPPTTGGAARWKIRYATQVSAHPLHFVLFVNRAAGFPEAYLGYLTNQIRRECQLDSVPIRLSLRASSSKPKT